MIGSRLLILIAVILLTPAFSLAQQSNSTRVDEKDAALKAKAYELLESLSTQLSTLQSAENRARIGSNIAGSLWPHHEVRARALFVSVGQDIRLGWQGLEADNPADEQTLMVFLQLRTDTIDRIAKYDPEFAFDFLKTTEPPAEQLQRAAREKERELALRLAKLVINTNPDLALKLGRVALANGFSEDVLTLLRPLLRKHRKQGVTFHKEIVGKLRNAKLTDWRVVSFIRNLAGITPPLADETTYGELTNFLITATRAMRCNEEQSGEVFEVSYVCSQLASLVSRGAKLEQLVSVSEARPSDVYAEIDEFVQAGDFDGLFQLAEKFPSLKPTISWRAFNLAQSNGDLERGEKIAAAYVGPPGDKERMMETIARAKDAAVLSEAELQEIQRQVATLADLRQRTNFLIDTAVRVGTNNRALALKLLDQLTEMVEAQKQGSERTQMLVGVAVLYCNEKSERGFSMMESQLPKLNEMIEAAVKLDGFDTRYLRDGEWNMSASGKLGELLNWLSNNAAYFAWCDFDRAVNLAAQFERSEIRMMAQLKLAQGVVAGPPKRLRINWGRN
ncbi:MAG TPA: hypothetical protein VJR02_14980 [Pyrinomonadaceae bacterium]|nr:hypothetical protein [Pyrinomonadaceae bacterium]